MNIGISNVITRDLEAPALLPIDDAERSALVAVVQRALRDQSYIHDAVFRGARARLFTNDFHLGDYFRLNFFQPQQWQEASGVPAAPPSLHVFAATGVDGPAGAFVHAESRTAVLLNMTHYAALRAATLHLVGPGLLSGAAVARNGAAVLLTGPDAALCAYGLMQFPTYRLLADGALAVHDGLAYPVERRFYRRTDLLPDMPELAYPFLTGRLENIVPDGDGVPDTLVDALLQTRHPMQSSFFKAIARDDLKRKVAALVKAPHGRAMLDPAALYSPDRAALDPARGLKVACAFALRRDPADRAVLRRTADAYELNVKPDAILASLKIINKTLETMPESVSLTVDDYMRYIA